MFGLKGKEELVVFCDLSPIQQQLYNYILSLPDFNNIKNNKSKCNCESNNPGKAFCCCQNEVPYMY